MKTREVKSFTLDESAIKKLKRYSEQETKGNLSRGLSHLIHAKLHAEIEDYTHRAPPQQRKWNGTGKCNPKFGGQPPCALCWGENATVTTRRALVMRNKKLIEEDVIHVENA